MLQKDMAFRKVNFLSCLITETGGLEPEGWWSGAGEMAAEGAGDSQPLPLVLPQREESQLRVGYSSSSQATE